MFFESKSVCQSEINSILLMYKHYRKYWLGYLHKYIYSAILSIEYNLSSCFNVIPIMLLFLSLLREEEEIKWSCYKLIS